MKTLIFSFIGSFLIGWIFPWWSVFLLGVLGGTLFSKNGWAGFFFSLLGVFLTWTVLAFVLDTKNDGLLSGRMAEMFSLPSGSLMILVSALIGGLVAGVGGLLGSLIRNDYFIKD